MARHYMAMLGTISPEPKQYKFKDKTKEFKYVQEAILNFINGADKITIFLTKAAKKKWVKEGDLKASLEKKYKDAIEEVDIDDGNNDDELMNIFTKIYESIDENDEVIFDITNGFRTLPMLAFTVINYAKTLKNITVEGIYYGAYIKDEPVEQILDLSIYMDIMETAFAANYFVSYGNVKRFEELSKNVKIKLGQETGIYDERNPMTPLYDAISKLNDLTGCINTCRGNYNKGKKRSIKAAYDAFNNKRKKITEEIPKQIVDERARPFELIFKYAEEKADQYFKSAESNVEMGMAVIQWCIDYELIQQGLTALRETIVTYAHENILFKGENFKNDKKYYDNRNDVERALTHKEESTTDTDEIKKLYDKLMENKRPVNEKEISLCNIYQKATSKRNDINHFGFREKPAEFTDFKENLESCYKEFKEYIKCQED